MNARLTIPPLFAEIADKLPATDALWIFGLILGAFVYCYYKITPWSLIATVLIAICWFGGALREFQGDFGRQVVAELGQGYLWHSRCAAALPLVAASVCLLHMKHRNLPRRDTSHV